MFRAPRAEVGSRVEEEKEKMERERGEGPKKTTPPHHDSGICRYCQHAGECTAVVQGEATSPEPAKGKEGSPPSYVYPDSDDGPDEGKDKKPAPPAGSKKLVQPAGPPPLTPLVDALAGFYEGQARFMPYCRQGSNPRRLRSAVAPESQQGPVPPEVEEIDQLSLCRAAFHHTS